MKAHPNPTKKLTLFLRSVGLLVGAIFLAGCEQDQATRGATPTNRGPAAAVQAASTNQPTADSAATNAAPPILAKLPPVRMPLPATVDEVVTLAEAGLEEDVLLAYVERSTAPFELGVEEILYLNDLGIHSEVVAALVRKAGPAAESALAALNAGAVEAPTHALPAMLASGGSNVVVQSMEPPAVPSAVLLPNASVEAAPAPEAALPPGQPVEQAVSATPIINNTYYFQEVLAPYGSWVQVESYGWCWQPTVAVVDSGWRPYCHRGRWVWTDCGWYWQSDYSWGWAAFHYGRWHQFPNRGWCWMPDTVWGPAWVSWRYTDSHCGWAPLPPAAHYSAGVGFTYRHARVGVGFDFGLPAEHYVFVGNAHLHDRHPYRHVTYPRREESIYRNSTVINNYVTGNNHTIINRGIDRERIAAVTKREIRKVPMQEVALTPGRGVRPDKFTPDGTALAVYRPEFRGRGAESTQAPGLSPSRAEVVKPRGSDGRTAGPGPERNESIHSPLRPRTSGTAAPVQSGGSPANSAKRTEPERASIPLAQPARSIQREPRRVPSVDPRASRLNPESTPQEQVAGPTASKAVRSTLPSQPTAGVPGPVRQASPTTGSSPSNPKPTPGARVVPGGRESTLPANRVPTAPARSTPTPRVNRPDPQPLVPQFSPAPINRSQPARPQAPAPAPARIVPAPNIAPPPSARPASRPQTLRQEPPKSTPSRITPAPGFTAPAARSPASPPARIETRSGGISTRPSARPPPTAVAPSPAPPRIAPAPAPSVAPAPSRPTPSPAPTPTSGGARGGRPSAN